MKREKLNFKNYDKVIPIPFKIYADSECSLKRISINKGGYTKLYQKHIPSSIAAKLVCIDNRFIYQLKFLLVVIVLMNLLHGFMNE